MMNSSKGGKHIIQWMRRAGHVMRNRYIHHTAGPSLLEQLTSQIKTGGPITVAQYMKYVLTNPVSGYYMKKDVFGVKGDFITSPEISQMFGEMIGIWCLNEWIHDGKNEHIKIIELGPGRGTLASDMLRVFLQFPDMKNLMSLHFVEVSPALAEIQRSKLNVTTSTDVEQGAYMCGYTTNGIKVNWYQNIKDISGGCSCYIAHEFLDALPVHKFQKTKCGYREVLIDTDPGSESKLRFVLAPGPTLASRTFISESENRDDVEVCPEAGVVTEHIAGSVTEYGSRALYIDYGHDGTGTDTFRAYSNHEQQDVLADIGAADLTADVDFKYIRNLISNKVRTFGPIPQGQFLQNMGIRNRLEVLLKNADNLATKKDLISGYDMIMNPSKMGARFKVFAITPMDHHRSPGGFHNIQNYSDFYTSKS